VWATAGSRLRLAHCDVSDAGGNAWYYSVLVSTSDARIDGCRIHDSLGNGLVVNGGRLTVRNSALMDNTWYGLSIEPGVRVDGLYLTLARNLAGVNVGSGATAVLTNTIVAKNTTGVNVVSGASAALSHTLWERQRHRHRGPGQ